RVKAGGSSELWYSAPSGKRTRNGVAVLAPTRSIRALNAPGMCRFYPHDRLKQPLFRLGAEAPQAAQASAAYRKLELVEGAHAQLPVEKAHPLGADPRQAQQVEDARRVILTQLLQGLARPGVVDLADLRRELGPDARHLGQGLAGGEQRRDVVPGGAQLAFRVAVGEDAVGVLFAQLEQVGDLSEHPGDVVVRHAPYEPSRLGNSITRSLVE